MTDANRRTKRREVKEAVVQAGGRIAVAGATGRVGRHVVGVLEARGCEIVPMSRSRRVDVISGEGLARALAGIECIVDTATGASPDGQEATEFFTTAARNLQEAGARAGVRRIVVVSIIGCDRFSAGYNAAKAAHEQALLSGPIPVNILRAAQFHEFVEQLVDWGTQDGISYVPEMRTQLVAARTVAEALADLATGSGPAAASRPGTPIPEIAGPRDENLVDAARLLVAHRGDTVRVEGVSNPADPDRDLYQDGALLPGAHAVLAGPSFADWLTHEMEGDKR